MEKKDYEMSIEELTKQCEEAKQNFRELNEQLKKAKQEEEDRKKAQLALEKEIRKKEVDEAYHNYATLLKAYIADYGSYSVTSTTNNWNADKFWHGWF